MHSNNQHENTEDKSKYTICGTLRAVERASLVAQMGKNLSTEDPVSISGSGRSPGEREWLPTPAFLPGKLDG